MENDTFKKGLEEIKGIRLGKEERAFILDKVLRGSIKSPYWSPHAIAAYVGRSGVRVFSFATILLLSGGGTAVLAAERSVPGDMLYSIKVNITEPALDKIYDTVEEKARWQGEKTVRRLREAETLALQGRLDEEKSKVIEEKIKEHGEEFYAVISDLSTSTESETRESVEIEYESKVRAHSKILSKISESHAEETRAPIENVAQTLGKELQKNQEREVERNREKKEKVTEEKRGAVTEEILNQRLKSVETSLETISENIKKEEMNLNGLREDVSKTMLEESGKIIEETRNKIRKARETKDRGDAEKKKTISDIEDSEQQVFETNTILKEIKKMDRPEKRKEKISTFERKRNQKRERKES